MARLDGRFLCHEQRLCYSSMGRRLDSRTSSTVPIHDRRCHDCRIDLSRSVLAGVVRWKQLETHSSDSTYVVPSQSLCLHATFQLAIYEHFMLYYFRTFQRLGSIAIGSNAQNPRRNRQQKPRWQGSEDIFVIFSVLHGI